MYSFSRIFPHVKLDAMTASTVALALAWFAGSTLNNVATKATMAVFPYPMTVVLAGLLAQIAFLLGSRACASSD